MGENANRDGSSILTSGTIVTNENVDMVSKEVRKIADKFYHFQR